MSDYYKKNRSKDPPSTDRILKLYDACFKKDLDEVNTSDEDEDATNKDSNKLFENKDDEDDLFWFLNLVAGTCSDKWKDYVTNRKQKQTKYRDLVTPTDEAFGIMVLEHHEDKWRSLLEKDKSNDENNGGRRGNRNKENNGNKNKTGVRGQSKTTAIETYNKYVKLFREKRKTYKKTFNNGEAWVEQRRVELMNNRKESTNDAGDEIESKSNDDDDEPEDDNPNFTYTV